MSDDKTFVSLLYADEAACADAAFTPLAGDSVIADLHIDQILAEVTKGYEEFDLEQLFRRKPARRRDAEFRLAVAWDMWDDGMRDEIIRYLAGFSTARRYLRTGESIYETPLKEKWKLDAAAAYVETIDAICARAGEKAASEGLDRFFAWVRAYAATEAYGHLRESALSVAAAINAVSYSLDVDLGQNTVCVGADAGAGDACEDLMKTFARYDLRHVSRDITAFADVNMNMLEHRILDVILAEHKNLQTDLVGFSRRFDGFIHENIMAFERDAHFYISYIMFAKGLEKKGFVFSIPRFLEDGGLSIDGGYDMSLAALRSGADQIVENSFDIYAGERSFVLTGPNQGGKTTFSRMLGQNLFFAWNGLPVPCRGATILWANALNTHFNVEENPGDDTGRLKEELRRLKRILSSAPANSFIILNELFSSATAYDALEMARRVIRLFGRKQCVCLYITHLFELAAESGVVSLVAETDGGAESVCTYKIARGASKMNALAAKLLTGRRLRAGEIKERINAAVPVV